MTKFAARAASRTKSPMSVESDHWNARPFKAVLRYDRLGVAGASEARIRRLRCDSG